VQRLRWDTVLPMAAYAALAILAAVCVAAWLVPAPKAGAVLGRLSYAQLCAASALSLILLAALAVAFVPERGRRTALKLSLSLGTALLAMVIAELTLFSLPARERMDNPWYLSTGHGTVLATELPYVRPPHLTWTGRSRGGLAVRNGDEDRYARNITFQTDADGFRNHEDATHADVVFLGDSYTEAGNVQEAETFAVLTGRDLGLSIRNLGRAGYTTPTEKIVLEKYALALEPRLLVWQIAEVNDLTEAAVFDRWVAAGRPRYFELDPKPPSRVETWRTRSPTYRTFLLLRGPHLNPWPLSGEFTDADGQSHPMRFFYAPSKEQILADHPGRPTFESSLLEGIDLAHERGIEVAVLVIPMKLLVMKPRTRLEPQTSRLLGARRSIPEAKRLAPALRDLLAPRGVEVIDATERLRAHAERGEMVYPPFDVHLSARGHEVVAGLLSEALSPRISGTARPPSTP
jgi:hypothetical protein